MTATEEKIVELKVTPDEQGRSEIICPLCYRTHLRSWLKEDKIIKCPHCHGEIQLKINSKKQIEDRSRKLGDFGLRASNF